MSFFVILGIYGVENTSLSWKVAGKLMQIEIKDESSGVLRRVLRKGFEIDY